MTSRISPSWINAYSVDFTSLPSQNIRTGGNGTKIIDGKNWTWDNDANSNTADVTNGTGIVLAASNTSVNIAAATRTSPILTIPVISLFPGYSVFNHVLRLQVRMRITNAITNFEFGAMGFEFTTTPTTQNFHMLKGFNATTNRLQFEDTIGGTEVKRGITTGFADDILSLIYSPMQYECRSGIFTDMPMNAQNTRFSCFQGGTNSMTQASTHAICLYYITVNTQGATDGFKVTYTHLQLDYLERLPIHS